MILFCSPPYCPSIIFSCGGGYLGFLIHSNNENVVKGPANNYSSSVSLFALKFLFSKKKKKDFPVMLFVKALFRGVGHLEFLIDKTTQTFK